MPTTEAAALLVLAGTLKAAKRRYASIYGGADLPSFADALEQAESTGLLKRSGSGPFLLGVSKKNPIEGAVHAWGEARAIDRLRAACAARLLSQTPRQDALAPLKNIELVLAALAARISAPDLPAEVGPTRNVGINRAVRTILEAALGGAFADFKLTESTSARPVTDDILLRLRNAVLGETDPIEGFANIVEAALNTSLGGSAESRWKALLVFSARSRLMLQPAYKRRPNVDLVDRLYRAVQRAASGSPTGWAPIANAFEALDAPTMSLAHFKEELRAAAREDIVELSPISVSSLMPELTKAKSELEVGGLKFHFVRMSRRLARD